MKPGTRKRHESAEEFKSQMWPLVTIQIEMKKRGLTYLGLSKCLTKIGLEDSERNLRKRISRGNFSASFFYLCLRAMDVEAIEVDLIKPAFGPGKTGKSS